MNVSIRSELVEGFC